MQLTETQERQLRELVGIFLEENAKMNLSAFRTEDSCWVGNVLDSLSFLEIFPSLSTRSGPEGPSAPRTAVHFPLSTLDLGTGGGFPLLPLAVCLPEVAFTGIDSVGKKID